MLPIRLRTTAFCFLCLVLTACDNRPDWVHPFDNAALENHDASDYRKNMDTRYLPTTNEHDIHSETKRLWRYPVFTHKTINDDPAGTSNDNGIAPAIMQAIRTPPPAAV
ncbi:hypothetical protein [Herbaspirillum autotrophicum]|uniref:hypothetical protein n=1 Tax=Herbaspirillum autotrophicum TaxID=180195 RepID=UPI000AF4F4F8|nr:hypothetical protein [Herbaspirillum autotrophicum]